MKSDPSFESLKKVLKKAWKNQMEDVDGIDRNYISNLSDELGLSRWRVKRAFEGLEEMGLARSRSEGGKRKLNVLVNLKFDEN